MCSATRIYCPDCDIVITTLVHAFCHQTTAPPANDDDDKDIRIERMLAHVSLAPTPALEQRVSHIQSFLLVDLASILCR